ncbi:MAG TPA: cytochrome P450 [Solirubrobacteraceae bacterium]|nr:cytochrome P450 [Solirubrobacteraceae bacterium]
MSAVEVRRTPRVSGVRVAAQTLTRGLGTDSLLIRGIEGEDITKFTFNRRTAFVLKHPDYADHVLHGAVEKYHKSIEYELLRTVVGLSLFTDEDESWRTHRMILNPVLAKRHLKSVFELMLAPIERYVARLEHSAADHLEINMTAGMTELTLDVVGSALFGHGMADLAQRIGKDVTAGLRAAERATRLLLVANPPVWLVRLCAGVIDRVPVLPPPLSRPHQVMRTIDEMVWDVIHDRQAHPTDVEDVLGLLLSVHDEQGEPLPLRRVRDEAATFMLAGHETTANALSWMWYLLALNPDARERMLAEVDAVLGDRRPAFGDVGRLPWTAACVQEAMRMYSPAWVVPRKCVADDVIGGHRIKRGSTVLIPINSLHHDERFWPEPEVFDPIRFLPENAKSHHRSAYLPFGGGRRVCIGKTFAMIEATLVTALMSRSFVYDLKPGHPVVPEATLTLRPRYGLKMVARRRGAGAGTVAAAA